MKLLHFALALSFANPAWALIDAKCTDQASNYLTRGDMGSPFGGDRLWALERMNRDYFEDESNECMQQIRTSAIADAKEYWVGYISSKYGCGAEDSLALPEERPEECPPAKWKLVKKNVQYIEAIENGKVSAGRKKKKKEVCGPKVDPVQGIADITVHLEDPCAKHGLSSNDSKNKTPGGTELSKLSSCLAGAGKGGSSLVDSLKSGYNKMAQFIKDPGYRASVMASLNDLYTVLKTSPKETLSAIYNAMATDLAQYSDKFQCMSPNGIISEICNQITKKGIPALLGMGAIRMAIMALKTGKKVSSGLVVLKDANRAVAVADESGSGAVSVREVANSSGPSSPASSSTASSASSSGRASTQSSSKPSTASGAPQPGSSSGSPAPRLGNSAPSSKSSTSSSSSGGRSSSSRTSSSAHAKETSAPSTEKIAGDNKTQVNHDAEKQRQKEAAAQAKAEAEAEAKAKADAAAQAKAKADADAKAKAEAQASTASRNKIDPSKDATEIKYFKNSPQPRTLDDVNRILNLPPGSSRDVAKKKLKSLLNKYHPDKNVDFKDEASSVSQKLGEMKAIVDHK